MKRTLCLLLLVTLVSTGCTDNLKAAAQALDETAKAVGVFESVVLNANLNHLLSDDTTRALLTFSSDISTAGKNATDAVRGMTSLTAQKRTDLLSLLGPALISVNKTISDLSVTVPSSLTTDPRTGKFITDVQAALTLIQTSLTAAQIALRN